MNLFVIGNGFDKAHGLLTGYSDFKKYLIQFTNKPEIVARTKYNIYYNTDTMTETDTQRHELYKKLSCYMPEELLWSNLECALGEIDVEQIQEDNSCYMKSYGADDWSDSAHHDYQYQIEQELSFTNDMKYWFFDWIAHVNTQVQTKPNIRRLMSCNDIFLNFNYTDTLEKTYGILENQILYIHGCVKNGGPLILGHHDTSHFSKKVDYSKMSGEEIDSYEEYMSGFDVRQLEANEIISKYFAETYKDTTAIINQYPQFWNILSAVDCVYILGHSLSEIDMEYFAKIRSKVSNSCHWYISCFSQEDYNKLQQMIQQLHITNYSPIQI